MKKTDKSKKQLMVEIRTLKRQIKKLELFSINNKNKTNNDNVSAAKSGSVMQMREFSALTDSIIENIPNMIFLKDAKELRFLRFNRAGEELLGRNRSELLGKNDYDFFTKQEADFFIKKDREVLSGKKVLDIPEEPIHTRKKGVRILHTKKVPILNKAGKPEYLLGISEDITRYKKAYVKIEKLQKAKHALKESETRYRVLFESASDAIFLANAQTGFIVDANKKASELIGRPICRIIGMHHLDLHPSHDREFYGRVFNSHASKSRSFSQVAFVCNSKGKHIPVQVSASKVILKGRKFLLGVFSDITELKKIEDRLKKDKSNLKNIVSKERKNLETALSGLEDTKRLADIGTLAAMIAHELRNPLGVIKTAVYNIRQKAVSPYIGKIRSHVDNIDKKIYESDRIISNLLSYSKALTPFYENLYIDNIIDECIVVFKQRYNLAKVRLIVNHSPIKNIRTKADKVQIISLLSNILDNAYQALPDNAGTIELDCRHHSKKRLVSIIIKDNGIGISKEDHVRAFEPFFSLKSKGIGLGLSVCRQIVKLHNGSIDIISEKSKGTTVKIALPAKDPVICV